MNGVVGVGISLFFNWWVDSWIGIVIDILVGIGVDGSCLWLLYMLLFVFDGVAALIGCFMDAVLVVWFVLVVKIDNYVIVCL